MASRYQNEVEKLYEYGNRLNEAKDKSQNLNEYDGIIIRAAKGSSEKAQQLAAQLIPRFFKHFPNRWDKATDMLFDLCEEQDLGVRVQAIRGLSIICKDTLVYVSKIVDVLVELLTAGEDIERDEVHKALMYLLRRDVKASLTALFRHIGSADAILHEKVLCFIRDKVFPLKIELLKPQEQMERHITDLVKNCLKDVTKTEFMMFIDFLRSLSLFGLDAPAELVHEFVELIEEHAVIDAQSDVLDSDQIDGFISCLQMALPYLMRGASNSKLLSYTTKHIVPVFDKIPEEQNLDLLKNLAECSSHTTPQVSRQLLPSVVQLLKKYMPMTKTGVETFTFVECLLYTFHHLAHKTPNATNSLCGYKIVTGQPSDRLGEDFSDNFKDFTERLTTIENLARASIKNSNEVMVQLNKAMAAAKVDEENDIIKLKQKTVSLIRVCNNILAMTQVLHSKSPSFIGDQKIILSWRPFTTAPGGKRTAAAASNVSSTRAIKKGRGMGGDQNQHISKALEGLSHCGRGVGWGGRGRGRGHGRGRGRGRGCR